MKRLIQISSIVFFISLSFGCATDDETADDTSHATGGSENNQQMQDPECAANDLSLGTPIRMSYDSGVAPLPKGGVLPSDGTYDLIDWTVYESSQGEAPEKALTYRFGPNNTVDASYAGIQASMTWMNQGARLFLTISCPSELKDSIEFFEYTVGDDTVTLISDDGVQILQKR